MFICATDFGFLASKMLFPDYIISEIGAMVSTVEVT